MLVVTLLQEEDLLSLYEKGLVDIEIPEFKSGKFQSIEHIWAGMAPLPSLTRRPWFPHPNPRVSAWICRKIHDPVMCRYDL